MPGNVRDWDREIMSDEDYQKLLGYKSDYRGATTDEEKKQANQNAEALRGSYGYGRGGTGGDFWWLGEMEGVGAETGLRLRELQGSNPAGNSQWYDQWSDLFGQYLDRGPFQYDLTSDALYQQYKQQYAALGDQAMQDVMGQTADLTGGYGSSYSQNAGQQAYNAYLQRLNELVPGLYDRAYGQYRDEGDALLSEAELARQFYTQELSDYWDELDYWTGRANREQDRADDQRRYADEQARDQRDFDYRKEKDQREFDYGKEKDQREFDYRKEKDQRDFDYQSGRDLQDDEYRRWKDQQDQNYRNSQANSQAEQDKRNYDHKVQQDAYDNLVKAIYTSGYNPTDAELAAAGMTRAEAERWRLQYQWNLYN